MLGICDKACNSSSKYGIRFEIESTNEDKNDFKVSDFWLAFLQSMSDSRSRHKSSNVSRASKGGGHAMPYFKQPPLRQGTERSIGDRLAVSSQHCA